jgi:hypothetical protein
MAEEPFTNDELETLEKAAAILSLTLDSLAQLRQTHSTEAPQPLTSSHSDHQGLDHISVPKNNVPNLFNLSGTESEPPDIGLHYSYSGPPILPDNMLQAISGPVLNPLWVPPLDLNEGDPLVAPTTFLSQLLPGPLYTNVHAADFLDHQVPSQSSFTPQTMSSSGSIIHFAPLEPDPHLFSSVIHSSSILTTAFSKLSWEMACQWRIYL